MSLELLGRFDAMKKYLVCLFIISGCTNEGSQSPYAEIVNAPPFATITDSIKREPGRDDLYFRRAVLLNQNNFPEPALEDFKKAWSLNRQEKYALGAGNIYLEKNAESALLFLNAAIKELPGSVLLNLSLARANDNLNRSSEALAIIDKILIQEPSQVDFLKLKSAILDKKGLSKESLLLLQQAYKYAPFDVELNYELGYKYAEARDPTTILLMDSLAAADSGGHHAEPYYYKGLYYSNINEKTKAMEQFNLAIARNYYFLNAYIEKGRLLFDQKKFKEAYQVFNLAMTISPKFADAYYWMGRCQEELGQKAEAKMNYQRAFGLDKTFTDAKEAADKLDD
jgi:tetratricopeptide (TPR) repeat protein